MPNHLIIHVRTLVPFVQARSIDRGGAPPTGIDWRLMRCSHCIAGSFGATENSALRNRSVGVRDDAYTRRPPYWTLSTTRGIADRRCLFTGLRCSDYTLVRTYSSVAVDAVRFEVRYSAGQKELTCLRQYPVYKTHPWGGIVQPGIVNSMRMFHCVTDNE